MEAQGRAHGDCRNRLFDHAVSPCR
jgi:hypothetical protein